MEVKKLNTSGLVLEGGAMRGMYTAGVLDVMMEEGIKMDYVIGVSAGALFGVNFVSGQIGRAIRYNKRFNSDRNYLGIKPFLKEGNIVSTKLAYDIVPRKLDPFDNEKFMESETKFYAVATNIETGKPEYFYIENPFKEMDILRASGSMPILAKPVEINGKLYLDGGIGDSIPYKWMMEHGADKTVVILTRDISYRKKQMTSLITRVFRKKYPNFEKSMANRHNLYNSQVDTLKKLERDGKAFVIRPSEPITISKTERDPLKLQGVYELGRKDAYKYLDSLRAYLDK